MNLISESRIRYDKKLYFLIGFFSVSGFYLGTLVVLSLGFANFSIFYSIPFRIFFCVLLAIAFYRSLMSNSIVNEKTSIVFLFFWLFYFIKILFYANSTLEETKVTWPEYIFYSISFCIIPFLCFSQISFHKYFEEILNGFIFSGFLLGLYSFFYYKQAFTSNIGRVSYLAWENPELAIINPLILSYSGVLTVTLCIFKLFFVPPKGKLYHVYIYIAIILGLIMFYLGASRGSIFSFVLSIPFFLKTVNSKRRVYLSVFLIFCIPLIYWGSLLTGSSVFERSFNIANDINTGSESAVRVNLWNDALSIFSNNLIFGGRIELENRYETGSAIYPHNLIIEVLMATGIIGALLLFPIIFKGVYCIFFNPSNSRAFIFSAILFIQGFAQYFFSGSLYSSMMFFMPLAMIISFYDKRNSI